MMDKAKDLASKKNLETKGNSIPSVGNSDPTLLVDLASKMKINNLKMLGIAFMLNLLKMLGILIKWMRSFIKHSLILML
jgi:hypothetical protein